MLRRSLVAVLTCAAALVAAAPAHALELGFNDYDLLQTPGYAGPGTGTDDAGMAQGLANAKAAGASIFRIQIKWFNIAPTQPASAAQAADPAWSGYQWAPLDRDVRAVVAAGLSPVIWMSRAPTWAEGANRPAISAYVPQGTWKPSATALKSFATALAKRYNGDFPDPLTPGTALPRIGTYQGWNEPNLYTELNPQYVGTTNTSVPMFRALENAVYDGVKSVNKADTVLAGALAPFGDYPDGGHRTPPAEFWRELLCISTVGHRYVVSKPCPKVEFDAWAHNPYSPYVPTRSSLNADDVTVPDLGKLVPLVKLGVSSGTIVPRGPKPLWITEISWDTAPDPQGISQTQQANNNQGATSILARAGAQKILFWQVRDEADQPNYATTYQSGIFTRGASPAVDLRKLAWTAYRFPLSAYRSHGKALIWGKAPAPGAVTIQRLTKSTWAPYLTLTAGSDGVFSKRVKTSAKSSFRAVQGSFTSLAATK